MKKILKIFMVLTLFAFVKPMVCQADVLDLTDNQSGLFRADNSITVTDKMEGSGFVAGNIVTVNNEVDGMLFTAGNMVNVSSKSDYLFAAGSSVNVTDAEFKDGFVAGSEVKLNVNALRDLYAAGSTVNFNGAVGRNLFVAGETVTIDGTINGDLFVDATNLVINSNTVINGKLTYNEDAKTIFSKDAIVTSKNTYKSTSRSVEIDTKSLNRTALISKLISRLMSFLNILVVGLLMILLIPKLFNKLKEIEANRLLPSFAWGLLILAATPVVAIIAMFTYVGIATGILVGVLYGVLVYISSIFSTFVITKLILKDKVKNPYLILLIGLACLYVIKLIPFVGGLVSFACLCLGLGLLTNIIKRK